jgi:hypothetical protein
VHLFLSIDSRTMASADVVHDDEFEEQYDACRDLVTEIESLVEGLTFASGGMRSAPALLDQAGSRTRCRSLVFDLSITHEVVA